MSSSTTHGASLIQQQQQTDATSSVDPVSKCHHPSLDTESSATSQPMQQLVDGTEDGSPHAETETDAENMTTTTAAAAVPTTHLTDNSLVSILPSAVVSAATTSPSSIETSSSVLPSNTEQVEVTIASLLPPNVEDEPPAVVDNTSSISPQIFSTNVAPPSSSSSSVVAAATTATALTTAVSAPILSTESHETSSPTTTPVKRTAPSFDPVPQQQQQQQTIKRARVDDSSVTTTALSASLAAPLSASLASPPTSSLAAPLSASLATPLRPAATSTARLSRPSGRQSTATTTTASTGGTVAAPSSTGPSTANQAQQQRSQTLIVKQFKDLFRNPPTGISVSMDNCNVHRWNITMIGPPGTPYEGGIFPCSLLFPADYPTRPPVFTFLTPNFVHPNVFADGKVCISILHEADDIYHQHEPASEKWRPILGVEQVLISVMSLLNEPNPNSPANPDVTKLFRSNPREYRKQVIQMVRRTQRDAEIEAGANEDDEQQQQ